MQKTLLRIVCSTLLYIPFLAQAEVTLYGQANISVEEYDDGMGAGKQWETQSNESFVGIKGFYKIKQNLTAIYRYDLGLNLSDNQGDSTDSSADQYISALNSYIGLQGRYGRIVAGTLDTPLKQIKEPFILFNNIRLGDMGILANNSDIRADNMLEYTSPALDGISFKYMALPEDGDSTNGSLTAASSTALIYETQSTVVAYGKDQDVAAVGTNNTRYVISFINPSYSLSYLKDTTSSSGAADIKTKGYSLSYSSGNTQYKYQQLKNDSIETSAVGIDYKLAQNAILGFYSIDKKGGAGNAQKNTGVNLVINFE